MRKPKVQPKMLDELTAEDLKLLCELVDLMNRTQPLQQRQQDILRQISGEAIEVPDPVYPMLVRFLSGLLGIWPSRVHRALRVLGWALLGLAVAVSLVSVGLWLFSPQVRQAVLAL